MSNTINFKSINTLAVPATVSGIAEPLLSITDTAIVGNIPVDGLESLAAAGIVGSFLSMLVWVLGQTRSSISTIISQYLGAGKLEEVKRLPAQAIYFNLLLSLLVLGSTIFVVEEIFSLFNASGKILDYCVSYYSIRAWGLPLTLLTFAIFGIFRGLQNTFYPMVIALIGALLNLALDFALVYGIEGLIPAMYLEGAAWASLIAQGTMAVLAVLLLLKKTDIGMGLVLPINKEMKRLIQMSLNLFVRTLALNVALMLAVREATALGDPYIGAHTIAINLWLFFAFFIDGYSAAGNSMGGRLLGANDYGGLWTLAKKIMAYSMVVCLVLMGLSLLFYGPIGEIFSNDTLVLQIFNSFFYLLILGLPISTLAFVFDGLFKGLGEMGYLRNVLLAATFLGFVPSLYLGLHLGWGIHAIWVALAVWMLVRGGALLWKFKRKYRPLAQNL